MSASRRRVQAREGQKERVTRVEGSADAYEPSQRPQGLTASQLLTPEQLAERLQIPKTQVYRLTRRGQLPAVRLGKYYRYRVDEIEEWEREGGTRA